MQEHNGGATGQQSPSADAPRIDEIEFRRQTGGTITGTVTGHQFLTIFTFLNGVPDGGSFTTSDIGVTSPNPNLSIAVDYTFAISTGHTTRRAFYQTGYTVTGDGAATFTLTVPANAWTCLLYTSPSPRD